MKVKSDQLPKTDLIGNALDKIDFWDTFSTTNSVDSNQKIVNKIFGQSPKWITVLMHIRNRLVSLIGLKTAIPEAEKQGYRVGGHIGFFQFYTITEHETILGADDKHLKFRVSVFNTQSSNFNIKVTTLVSYQNRLGKVYFFLIKPFHKMVVRRMVKQAYYNPS